LGPGSSDARYVYKHRTRQGLIRAILDRFRRGHDHAIASVYTNQLQLICIFFIIGQTKKAQSVSVTGNALHKNIVIFTCCIVTPAHARLSHDGFGKVVVCARGDTRPIEVELLIRPGRIDLTPTGNDFLRRGFPNLAQVVDSQARHPVVTLINHDNKSIVSNPQFNEVYVSLRQLRSFIFFDRSRCVIDINFTPCKLVKPTARSRYPDRYLYAWMIKSEFFGYSLCNRIYGAGSVNSDVAREITASAPTSARKCYRSDEKSTGDSFQPVNQHKKRFEPLQ